MTDTENKKVPRRSLLSKGRMADTPHGVDHPLRDFRHGKRLKKSTYFGVLLYLLRVEHDRLTREQQLWITNYARKLSDEEILRAGKFSEKLLLDENIRFFHVRDILHVRKTVPWIDPFQAKEQVRIGKGYTDKGALRPLHKRGRNLSGILFWDQDIAFMLPFDHTLKGEWITADEVKALLGENLFELVVQQLRQGRTSNADIFSCVYL